MEDWDDCEPGDQPGSLVIYSGGKKVYVEGDFTEEFHPGVYYCEHCDDDREFCSVEALLSHYDKTHPRFNERCNDCFNAFKTYAERSQHATICLRRTRVAEAHGSQKRKGQNKKKGHRKSKSKK